MTVDQATLQRAWDEIAYRKDVRHVTKGAHNERLWLDYWETVIADWGPFVSLSYCSSDRHASSGKLQNYAENKL